MIDQKRIKYLISMADNSYYLQGSLNALTEFASKVKFQLSITLDDLGRFNVEYKPDKIKYLLLGLMKIARIHV